MAEVWMIRGFDSMEPIYSEDVPVERFSDEAMIRLLQCLASRHLEPYEITRSSFPEGCEGRLTHLDVTPATRTRRSFMTNGNPHYVASVVEDES